MLKSNEYFYEDEYMYFTFNGIHSSRYNVIIQNDKEQTLFIERDTKIEFVQPKNKIGQYMLGVSHPQRQFPLKLIASDVSSIQIEQILKWLQPGATGNLSFDYSKNWEYDVVIQNLKNPTQITVDYNRYDLVLDIVFVTLENSVARNVLDGFANIDPFDANAIEGVSNLSAYNIPAFSYVVSNYTKNKKFANLKQIDINVHNLGNDNIEIGFKSSVSINSATEPKTIIVNLNDVYKSSTMVYLYPNDTDEERIATIEYNAHNNLFFINGVIAEEYINSNALFKPKSLDTETPEEYSYFLYNMKPLSIYSQGSPVLLNYCTQEDIRSLITQNRSWFICETEQIPNNTFIYYQPDTLTENPTTQSLPIIYDTYYQSNYETDKIVEAIVSRLNAVKSRGHNLYFGFYHTISIITNLNMIQPYITQFNFTA